MAGACGVVSPRLNRLAVPVRGGRDLRPGGVAWAVSRLMNRLAVGVGGGSDLGPGSVAVRPRPAALPGGDIGSDPCEGGCMRKYVIMGIQGSGKGTHAKMLAGGLDLEHIAVGDIFRWNVQHHTKLGAQVRDRKS